MGPSEPVQAWLDLQARFEKMQPVLGEVVDHDRGGLVVSVEGLRGYVPLSQIVDLPPDLIRSGPIEDLAPALRRMHGRRLMLYVVAINWRRNRLILSQRRGGGAGVQARLRTPPPVMHDHAVVAPELTQVDGEPDLG